MRKIAGIALFGILAYFFWGCRKMDSPSLPDYEIKRIKQLGLESAVISKILEEDGSSFYFEPTWMWRPQKIARQLDEAHPPGYDSSKKHIYVGIVDKFYPAPNLGDSSFLDFNFTQHGIQKKLIDSYMANRDRSQYEMPIDIKHRYVFVHEDDYRKPHMSLRNMPKKYVDNFCLVRFSRPTFNDEKIECLTFYENMWAGRRSVIYARMENGKWEIIATAPTSPQERPVYQE